MKTFARCIFCFYHPLILYNNTFRDLYPFLQDANHRSPFHYASIAGSLACCEELIHASSLLGLPIDQRDAFNQTPLMYAASVPSG